MRTLRLAGMVAAALAFVPLAAAASDTDDALKLAQRVATMGFGRAEVKLHALPSDFPSAVPLPAATLVGSVSERKARDGGTVGNTTTMIVGRPTSLYYDVSGDRNAVVRAYEASLRAAGWVRRPSAFSIQHGGFEAPWPQIAIWCSAGTPPTVVGVSAPPAETTALNVSVMSPSPGTGMQCSDSPSIPLGAFKRSPLPTLTASNGIELTASGSATDGSTTGARIRSSLGLGTVFETFAKQLRDAGWTPGATAASAGLQSQTFTKTVDGTAYVALLAIHALDATHYVALADVSNRGE